MPIIAERSSTSRLPTFCKAYPAAMLRQFPGWLPKVPPLHFGASPGFGSITSMPDDGFYFLQPDLTVTAGVITGREVAFDELTPQWRDFCRLVLRAPDSDPLDEPGAGWLRAGSLSELEGLAGIEEHLVEFLASRNLRVQDRWRAEPLVVLGADSIVLLELVHYLKSAFGATFSVVSLLDSASVRTLAQEVWAKRT